MIWSIYLELCRFFLTMTRDVFMINMGKMDYRSTANMSQAICSPGTYEGVM